MRPDEYDSRPTPHHAGLDMLLDHASDRTHRRVGDADCSTDEPAYVPKHRGGVA